MAAKVSLGFATLSDTELDNFAQGVIDRMAGNATFHTPHAQSPLPQPQNLSIKNGGSGQLVATVSAIKNTSMYEGRAKQDGDWMPSIFSGSSKQIIFTGLTPGKTYTIQVRALGGSTGQPDWSDPSSHMVM
jgi:hypothetical protein